MLAFVEVQVIPQETKILGTHWNPDHLIFSVSDVARAARIVEPTKRNVISVVGRIHDQQLVDSLLDECNSLVRHLQVNIPISIPRCYLHDIEDNPTSITLCGFCDASTKAYAAVIYPRVKAV